jgi:hypothetical protein
MLFTLIKASMNILVILEQACNEGKAMQVVETRDLTSFPNLDGQWT